MTYLHWLPGTITDGLSQFLVWQIPRVLKPFIRRSDSLLTSAPFIKMSEDSMIWPCSCQAPIGTLVGKTLPQNLGFFFTWSNQIRHHQPEPESFQSPTAFLLVNESKAYCFEHLWPISGSPKGKFTLGYSSVKEIWMLREFHAARALMKHCS